MFTDSKLLRLVGVAMVLATIIYSRNFARQAYSTAWMNGAGRVHPAKEAKMTVLVTGAAGYIGSHACLHLLEEGHAVVGLDNLSRGNLGAVGAVASQAPKGRFNFVELDLGNTEILQKLFKAYDFDLVMHFAAIAYVGESVAEPLRYYQNVTSNTVALLDSMNKAGVNKLVYSSSCATYGGVPRSAVPVTEDTPAQPNNPYGWSKWMAEQAIRDYSKANPNFKAVILRYFNVYGSDPSGRIGEFPRPSLRHHGRISNACFDAALGHINELTILGTNHPTPDGTCIRDYIHVTDLIGAHVKVAGHLANPPALYNVGTGRGVSVKEFVDACIKVTGKSIKVKQQQEARPGDYPEMWAIPQKIMDETGWRAKYTNVEEGLMHAWQWRMEHPDGYH